MPSPFSKELTAELIASIRRYFEAELEIELSEMKAGFVLEYFAKEIAPLAYNEGVEDARRYFAAAVEDLPGACFREALTYWKDQGSGKMARRKPNV